MIPINYTIAHDYHDHREKHDNDENVENDDGHDDRLSWGQVYRLLVGRFSPGGQSD